ncbi:hypothetical protein J6590_075336 [Homalodisca vitripennis]|nr:hypothetical protein J6590_075336 [Homalodisca vitripennis]
MCGRGQFIHEDVYLIALPTVVLSPRKPAILEEAISVMDDTSLSPISEERSHRLPCYILEQRLKESGKILLKLSSRTNTLFVWSSDYVVGRYACFVDIPIESARGVTICFGYWKIFSTVEITPMNPASAEYQQQHYSPAATWLSGHVRLLLSTSCGILGQMQFSRAVGRCLSGILGDLGLPDRATRMFSKLKGSHHNTAGPDRIRNVGYVRPIDPRPHAGLLMAVTSRCPALAARCDRPCNP